MFGPVGERIVEDHPIFGKFTPFLGHRQDYVDWIGMRYKSDWWTELPAPRRPRLDEEYFEWIDLLEAVVEAEDRFTMLELGAGFGRWGIRGALAAKQRGIRQIAVRFVEGEPQHAAWIREAVELNGLGDIACGIFEAAISYSAARVPFALAPDGFDARSSWGQSATCDDQGRADFSSWRDSEPTGRTYFGLPVRRAYDTDLIQVAGITFEGLTADLDFIDFVDMEIQGSEAELIEHAISTFDTKVGLVHIGTHAVSVEDKIRTIFRNHGWTSRWDFSTQGKRETPFGPITFGDGIQAWRNPRL